MSEVRATTMATKLAKEIGITRTQAFDAILSVAIELELSGTRFSEKAAHEIEAIVIRDASKGSLPVLKRRMIGA